MGEVVQEWDDEMEPVTAMETRLPSTTDEQAGKVVRVWLRSVLTEVGRLELWGVSREDAREWRLEFNLRDRE